jgi:hypothetical protein
MGTLTVDQLNELGRQMTVSLNYELERSFSQLEHQFQTLQTAIQEMLEAPPQQVSVPPKQKPTVNSVIQCNSSKSDCVPVTENAQLNL